jgi:NAD(P)-dependent dehydrogenase (short-subunit alcohol dehydrogenase family)
MLSDKVAIVTGAGGEIGRAIASGLWKAGARVVWVGRHAAAMEQLARELSEDGERWHVVRADVRREEDVRRIVRAALRRFGPIDILINNAGVRGPTAPAVKLPRKAWEAVLETNLTSPFLCARECLKHMQPRRQGQIINISSIAGRMAYPLRASYASSKWGLIGLTLTLAQEAGAWNVQVNAICPGPVDGRVMEEVIARRARVAHAPVRTVRQQFLRPAALGRMVSPDDVSETVLFLCSPAARNITGQVIEVSAGFGLWPG